MQNTKSRRIKKGTPSRKSLNCALCIVNYTLKKAALRRPFIYKNYHTETPTVSQIYLSQPKESDSCPIPFCYNFPLCLFYKILNETRASKICPSCISPSTGGNAVRTKKSILFSASYIRCANRSKR